MLDDSEKYQILSNKWSPISSEKNKYSFPITNGRRYNLNWEEKFNWLRYSPSQDAAFCAHYIALGLQSDKLVTGLKDWKNAMGSKRGTLLIHEESNATKTPLLRH